ncbi:hypothetical protein RFI_08616, partial [Reticulomyxa filosa]
MSKQTWKLFENYFDEQVKKQLKLDDTSNAHHHNENDHLNSNHSNPNFNNSNPNFNNPNPNFNNPNPNSNHSNHNHKLSWGSLLSQTCTTLQELVKMEQDMNGLERDEIIARYYSPQPNEDKHKRITDVPTASPQNDLLGLVYSDVEEKVYSHSEDESQQATEANDKATEQRPIGMTTSQSVKSDTMAATPNGNENGNGKEGSEKHECLETMTASELIEKKQMEKCLELRQQWWTKLDEMTSTYRQESLDNVDLFFELCSAIELALSLFPHDQHMSTFFTLAVRESLRVVVEVLRCVVMDCSLSEVSQQMEKYYDGFVILHEYEEAIEHYLAFWA